MSEIEIHERLTKVETILAEVKNNDIPHIFGKISKLDNRLWWILGSVILGFATTIALKFLL